jgi:hypothetical protein
MIVIFDPALPASSLFTLMLVTEPSILAYAGGAVFAVLLLGYLVWSLPIHAWLRKPIEVEAKCPHCGSRDFRPSYVQSRIDGLRKKMGLIPFRCRGCAKRFISRCSRDMSSELEAG